MQPNFLVVGAAKAGTTTLQHWLASHPQIFVPRQKELRYFAFDGLEPGTSTEFDAAQQQVFSWQDYLRHFEATTENHRAIGEVAPIYLESAWAVPRIQARLGRPKIVIVLREPVARAYSDYLMHRRDGTTDLPFAATLCELRNGAPAWGHFVRVSQYYEKVARYLEAFGREGVHILLTDDMAQAPDTTFAAICAFLGVDARLAPPSDVGNRGGLPRLPALDRFARQSNIARELATRLPDTLKSPLRRLRDRNLSAAPPLGEQTRAALAEALRPEVERLAQLIDRDLSHWLGTGPAPLRPVATRRTPQAA